jgi:hypothetical protein
MGEEEGGRGRGTGRVTGEERGKGKREGDGGRGTQRITGKGTEEGKREGRRRKGERDEAKEKWESGWRT